MMEKEEKMIMYFDRHKQETILFFVLVQYVVTILDQIENLLNLSILPIAKMVHYVDHLWSNVVWMDHVHLTNF
jgi:hypothetical protein